MALMSVMLASVVLTNVVLANPTQGAMVWDAMSRGARVSSHVQVFIDL